MAFFEELEQMMNETGDRLSKMAKDMAEQGQYSRESAKLQYKLNNLYKDLGKTAYENAVAEGEQTDVSAMISEITQVLEEIKEKKSAYCRARGIVICDGCGKEIDKDYAFCPSCGKKVEVPAEELEEETPAEDPADPSDEEEPEPKEESEE